MKGKNKPISLIFISLLVLSTMMIIYTPAAESGPFKSPNYFEGTIEPQVVSGAYPYPRQKFTFNITFLAGTDEVDITLPAECTFVSAYSENNTIIWAIDTTTPSVVKFYNDTASTGTGVWDIFYVTVDVKTSGYTTIEWGIKTFKGGSSLGSDTVNVSVTPWFDATISPVVIQTGKTQWFDIVITNNASTPSIYKVKITYPDTGWVYGDVEAPPNWVIDEHNTVSKYMIFRATGGYEIKPNKSATFRFYMTTGSANGNWVIECTNTAAEVATMTSTVTIDNTAPTITINKPTLSQRTNGYSVGAGNHIWINTTITDNWDALPTIYINASFNYKSSRTGAGAWTVNFYNTTAIPDGKLVFYINATDAAGNKGTTGAITVEINNLAPKIIGIKLYDSSRNPLPEPQPGKFYMNKAETAIYVNVTVWEPHLDTANSKIYMNTTCLYTLSSTTNNTLNGPYTVGTANYATIKIVTFDTASPVKHSFNKTVELIRDLVPPHAIGFTSAKAICGGLVIYGLYASDNVGIYDFVFKVNGSSPIYVYQYELEANYWTGGFLDSGAFAGVVVLDLHTFAGKFVNITVLARDYGLNTGATKVVYAGTVPKGLWYPIELQKGWNLISLPLVPANSSIENVLSLLLKEGLLESVWTYDAETKTWHSYAPGAPPDLKTMVDGKGYFIKMKAYNVLIVQGVEQPSPPQTPPVYHVVPGWNLIGYKELTNMKVEDYLSGVEFIRVYWYNAATQTYGILMKTDLMNPCLGYWVAVKTEGWIYP
jgi:hypothetical protein